jgi:aldose 1-epimerase
MILINIPPGIDTLHGGLIGYDQRPWNVSARSASSITFKLLDPDGFQGFPGTVIATVSISFILLWGNKAQAF